MSRSQNKSYSTVLIKIKISQNRALFFKQKNKNKIKTQ